MGKQKKGERLRTVNGTGLTLVAQLSMLPSLDADDLAQELEDEITRLETGDLGMLDGLLVQQASVLHTLFVKLLVEAGKAPASQAGQLYAIALKAQAASRSAMEALHRFRNPSSTTFIRQANLAHNQQVNNRLHQRCDICCQQAQRQMWRSAGV